MMDAYVAVQEDGVRFLQVMETWMGVPFVFEEGCVTGVHSLLLATCRAGDP